MKCTSLLVLTMFATAGSTAFANSTVCSSANQNLSVEIRTSNGGAPLDYKKVTYNGAVAESHNPRHDPPLHISITERNVLSSTSEGGMIVKEIYSARASGKFLVGEQLTAFNEIVICEDERAPMCHQCP